MTSEELQDYEDCLIALDKMNPRPPEPPLDIPRILNQISPGFRLIRGDLSRDISHSPWTCHVR